MRKSKARQIEQAALSKSIANAPLQVNNLWVDRDDGNSIVATTSNSIQINPPAVFVKSLDNIADNLVTMNTGIQKSSKLIPYNTNIT